MFVLCMRIKRHVGRGGAATARFHVVVEYLNRQCQQLSILDELKDARQ